MPRVYINYEAFELIEKLGSISAEQLAKHIGVKQGSAATWLSRWAKKDYLEYVYSPTHYSRKKKEKSGPRGYYKIGKKWWGELAFDVNKDQG